MDEVEEMLAKHKWPKACRRVAIVPPEERVRIPGLKGGRNVTKYYTQSEGFSRNNKGMTKLREKIEAILPDWFVPDERSGHFVITINKDVTCYPHRDALNSGDQALLYLGDFTGGELVLEDGTVLSETRVWHRFNGKELLHWNLPHKGTKYSIIAANNQRQICYHRKRSALADAAPRLSDPP